MDERDEPVRRETTVINTGERRGGAGTLVAIVLLLIVATLGFLYFGGYLQRAVHKTDIDVKVDMPDINIDRPKTEPSAGNRAK